MNDLEDIRWKETSNNSPDLNKGEQEIPSILDYIIDHYDQKYQFLKELSCHNRNYEWI